MNGRIILTNLRKEWEFPEIWPLLFLNCQRWPYDWHGACGYVIYYADVLQWAYTDAQGLVEVNLSAILDLLLLSC